ncbi:hypothetical protein FQR65_LT14990 [Abscondita terminalis]|nr:hypothetical protein FQR65_LT14990 [Abscondita terminalis]
MISLGSCTMKLNAAAEMLPLSWGEWGSVQLPFVPKGQALGYQQLIEELERDLAEITGFAATSLQPNSGAQDPEEISTDNVVVIPQSAHGTNPASAAMAGMKVVVVKNLENGEIDFEDLKLKVEQNKENLSALDYISEHYPILYSNQNDRVAHECIVRFSEKFKSLGIEVADIAKRLMDYGNSHAPTVSFPVAGTLMIEPTESESKAEIDRFAEALISIRKEIDEIAEGVADAENNVLKNAPHTMELVISDAWDKPYTREKAAYPLEWVRDNKFFAAVSRVDEAYGDRNLICTCTPIEAYM